MRVCVPIRRIIPKVVLDRASIGKWQQVWTELLHIPHLCYCRQLSRLKIVFPSQITPFPSSCSLYPHCPLPSALYQRTNWYIDTWNEVRFLTSQPHSPHLPQIYDNVPKTATRNISPSSANEYPLAFYPAAAINPLPV